MHTNRRRSRAHSHGFPFLIVLFSIIVRTVMAQEQTTTQPGTEAAPKLSDQFTLSSTYKEYRETDSGFRFVGVEAVRFAWKGVFVRADHVVVWTASSKPAADEANLQVPTEIYAEGNIIFRKGEEIVACHRMFLDLEHDRGVFIEATLGATLPTREAETTIFFRAGELRQLAINRFEALDVSLTTCSFGEPHYHLHTDRLSAQIDPLARKPNGRPDETTRNVRLDVDGSVLVVGDLPVFALPSFVVNSATAVGSQFYLVKQFSVDSSRRFGPSVRLTLGDDIDVDDRKWGEWRLHTQYLGDRGPGVGLDLTYRTDDYHGELVSIYQNDRGKDELFGEPNSEHRGRARWQHRHFLPEDIQIDAELSPISDIGFLPEYYEREFKSGKEQETLLYFKRAVENRSLTLLAKTRINEFQEQVEHLPQLGYNLISEPVVEFGDFSTLYFDADYEVTNVRRRFGSDDPRNDINTYRADLDNTVSLPFFVGPVKLRPFTGLRYSRYGRGRIVDDPIDRIATLYGINLTTEFWRTWNVAGGPLDLFGLRHIVLPEIEYRVADHVSQDPGSLLQFDRVDALVEEEALTFGLRNRLETIWSYDEEDRVVDVVDIDVEWTYYPQARRDNFGEHIGNIDFDALLRPNRELTLLTDFEYSFVLDTIEVLNSTVAWAPSRTFQGAIGYRRYVDVNDVLFVQANFAATQKWEFELQSGYDFVEGRFQDQRLTIRRLGHDWVFEIELGFDNGVDDFGIGIALSPRIFYDPRLRVRSLRYEPQFQSFGEGLIK